MDSNIKKGVLFTLFSCFNSGINFLLLLILAKFLSPSDYGLLSLFTTVITLLNIVISLNTTGFFSIEYFKVNKEEHSKIIISIFVLCFFVFLCLNPILYVVSLLLPLSIKLTYTDFFLALLICLVQVISYINLEIWRLEEKVILYGIYSMLNAAINMALSIYLITSFDVGWLGRVYANLIVSIFFSLLSIYILIRYRYLTNNASFDLKCIKELLKFGIPLIPHDASSWIRQGLDRYIIAYFYSSTDVGLFSFAFNFANIIHIVGSAFNKINSVHIFKELSDIKSTSSKMLKRQSLVLITIFLAIFIIVYIGIIIVVPAFFIEYNGALKFLFPLCISALFQSIYYIYVNYLFFYKKTMRLMFITTLMSLLHVLLSLLLTQYSVLNAAYVTLFVNAMITFLVYKNSIKLIGLK
jgi:O-antigen/teichoic acid export membrane protein